MVLRSLRILKSSCEMLGRLEAGLGVGRYSWRERWSRMTGAGDDVEDSSSCLDGGF